MKQIINGRLVCLIFFYKFFSSSKGVPHHLEIHYESYLKALYDPFYRLVKTYCKLQYKKSVSSISLIKMKKSTLNSRYTKLFLEENLVICRIHEGL